VVRLSLAEPHPELHVWATRLQAALQPAAPAAAVPVRALPRASAPTDARDSRFGFAPTQPPKRYVGSLR